MSQNGRMWLKTGWKVINTDQEVAKKKLGGMVEKLSRTGQKKSKLVKNWSKTVVNIVKNGQMW
jgi:hypothetical protein